MKARSLFACLTLAVVCVCARPVSAQPIPQLRNDLGGTAPAPEVVGILNHALPSLSLGYMYWNGSAWVFQTPAGFSVSGTGFPIVIGGTLQTAAYTLSGQVTSGTPSGGNVPTTFAQNGAATGNTYYWNGSAWTPGALNLAGGSGYVTGLLPSANLGTITLTGPVTASASGGTLATTLAQEGASTGNTYGWNGSAWSPSALNLAGGANYVTGLLPPANFGTLTLTGDTTGAASGGTIATQTSKLQSFSGPLTAPENGSWSQASWYLDPQSAVATCSDTNAGTSSSVPLCTFAEITRRWGTTAPNLPQTTTIYLESSQTGATDPAVVTVAGDSLYITGVPSQQASGTISSLVALNRSTPQFLTISALSGMAVGQLVTNTTRGSSAFVYKLSGGVATLSTPVTTSTGVEDLSWANGNSITSSTLPALWLQQITATGTNAGYVSDINIENPSTPSTAPFYFGSNTMVISSSVQGPAVCQSTASRTFGASATNVYFESTLAGQNLFVAGIPSVGGQAPVFTGSLNITSGIVGQLLGGSFLFYGDPILASLGSGHYHNVDSGIVGYDTGLAVDSQTLTVNQYLILQTAAPVWGTGSLNISGGVVEFVDSAVNVLKLTGSLSIQGQTSVMSTSATGTALVTLTAANLDAAAGPTGFGDNAFLPGIGGFQRSGSALTGFTAGVGTASVSGTGLWTSTSGALNTSASIGTADQLLDTNHAGTATEWFTLGGDCGFASHNITCTKVNGTTIPAGGGLTTGNQLIVSGASAATWAALNLAGGSGYVTGTLPLGNEGAPTGTGIAHVASGAWSAAASLGTANQVPIVNSGATDYAWGTITNASLTAGSFTNITGVGTLTAGSLGSGFTLNLSLPTISNTLSPANGGTGAANPSANGVAVANGSSTFNFESGTSAGQFLGWNSSGPPTFQTIGFSSITGSLALSQIAQGGATTNQVLEWNGSAWAPVTITLTGDVTGSASGGSIATTVASISGTTPILITPNELRWTAGTTAPELSQAAASSGAGADILVKPQAATTTGASGNLTVNVSAPASGTTEAGFKLERAGTFLALMSRDPSFSSYTDLWMGDALSPGANNYALTSSGSVTALNSTGDTIIGVNGTTIAMATSAGFTVPANTQLGSNTTSFGGGSTVVGITNATVAPSTAPTGGGVLSENGGQLNHYGSGGAQYAVSPTGIGTIDHQTAFYEHEMVFVKTTSSGFTAGGFNFTPNNSTDTAVKILWTAKDLTTFTTSSGEWWCDNYKNASGSLIQNQNSVYSYGFGQIECTINSGSIGISVDPTSQGTDTVDWQLDVQMNVN